MARATWTGVSLRRLPATYKHPREPDDSAPELQARWLHAVRTNVWRTSSWARGGSSSRPNHRMSSCSSGATFVGLPSHSRTSQALSSAGSSAGPAVTRHRCSVEPVAIRTPSSSCSSRVSAPSSDSPSSMTPPGRSHWSGYARLFGLRCARRTRSPLTSAPTTTLCIRAAKHGRPTASVRSRHNECVYPPPVGAGQACVSADGSAARTGDSFGRAASWQDAIWVRPQ